MSQCLYGHGGRHGRRTSIPQKMLLDLHFILRLYLGQRNTKVYHRPFKWWSHSLGGPTKLFHKNKDHHSSQTKQMIPDIFIVIERRKECWRVWRKWEMPPKQPGALGHSWYDHLLPPGQDMTCDDYVIMRHHDDGDPETDDRKCQYIVHISTPLLHLPFFPSFSFHRAQYWPIKGQDKGHVICLN